MRGKIPPPAEPGAVLRDPETVRRRRVVSRARRPPRLAQQQPQQTGMPFIIMQQVQPAFIMAVQQSQHAWIMAQQSSSPLVQVMRQPVSVISQVHVAIIMLQQQAIMPFIIMQHETMPPAIIVQRFWSMPAVTVSSQTQVTLMPPSHFSNVILQRGTIIMFMPAGMVPVAPDMPGVPPIAMPGIPIPARSIIIAVVTGVLPRVVPLVRN
jgi:hypothetical protein